MKKLNKLQINPEKQINQEELLTLRGGYGAGTIKCYSEGYINGCMGYLGSVSGTCSTFGAEQALCAAGGFSGTYCTEC